MENKEKMSFNSPEQMLDAILKGEKDLYNVKTGDYVFHYSESGSIAVYNLTSEEAEELDKKAIENGEYWGAFLGGGGEIWDDPERAAENEQDCNLDYCKKVYALDGWVDVSVYAKSEEVAMLCKAQRIDNGEWVEGFYFCMVHEDGSHIHHFIMPLGVDLNLGTSIEKIQVEIRIETLSPYTGLTDANGNKIWKNDIVEFEDVGEEGYEFKEGYEFANRARVEFAEARWSLTDFAELNSGVVDEMYDHAEFKELWNYCKVIGNIFDNPELLGGGLK